ncbi:MAG: bifunctional oligoribonuclease/PAP phosphatase NrnA [Lentimicrobiaceae bacterium]|jgi:phosphoesterase RecJ-like protein|nr:bifunctional oligoribonuclease/PAP phosphatase NrnA [Lentimicrobiaceae bacterium]
MQTSFFETFAEILTTPQKIVITTHTNPDGDALGSSLALYHFVKQFEQEVHILIPNKYPDFLAWLPGAEQMIIFESNVKLAKQVLKAADYIFCLDYNAINRGGVMQDHIKKSNAKKVLIDHHRDPEATNFYAMLSDTDVSSTAELIFDVIDHFDYEKYGNQDITECIFVGIMTDTGSFSYSIYGSRTFEICARLVQNGLDLRKVHQNVYDTFSENRLRLLGFSISDRMYIYDDLSTAIILLSKADLQKFNYQIGDTEGIVNFPLSMKKIKLAILITERDDQIRLSFRSKGDFSVHELARNHFEGGGHKNAAGGSLYCSVNDVIEKVLIVLETYKNDLTKA